MFSFLLEVKRNLMLIVKTQLPSKNFLFKPPSFSKSGTDIADYHSQQITTAFFSLFYSIVHVSIMI